MKLKTMFSLGYTPKGAVTMKTKGLREQSPAGPGRKDALKQIRYTLVKNDNLLMFNLCFM